MTRLFRVFIPTSVVALLLSEAGIVMGSYVLALFLFLTPDYDPVIFLIDEQGLWRISLVVAVILLGMYFHDLYREIRVRHRVELLQQVCLTFGAAFLSQALLGYGFRNLIIPKWLMIEGSGIALLALYGWRLLFSATIWKAVGTQTVLFLGRSPIVAQVVDYLVEHPEFGFRPLGFLDETAETGDPPPRIPRLGNLSDLMEVATAQMPDQIVVGLHERRQYMPINQLLDLRFSGVHIEESSRLYEMIFGRICTREIRTSQLVFTEALGPRKTTIRLQSLYSRILAFTGLVVTFPILILVAIAVRLTSAGPVLFRQRRVGLREEVFTLYKFRSMSQDAEARTGPVWATQNDPRITPLGKWLRKTRLDELPQLFNVLRGDMAMVGPRPERPEFVEVLNQKIPYYRQRHAVMPGITGWAQINYKYGDTFEDTLLKLEYDLYYIKHSSLWLDFFVMFHTAKTMLLVRGAQ